MSPVRRLSRKSSIRWTGLCLWLAAVPAGAVGLGDMVLTSPPGQPLEAEIPIELVTAQELWALQVSVAPERTFLRNGLDRAPELDELRFEIVRDGDGGSVVRMTSSNPLVSSMTLLVEATWLRRPDWPQGRLVRSYSFGSDDLPAAGAPPRPVGAGSLESYGPVQNGETLWSLAERLRAPAVHTNQILVAIFEANPRGFGGNMNGIYQGATLRIPEAVQARRLTVAEATAEALRQVDAWLADLESRGQPALPGSQGESAAATPGADELQAELQDTRQLLETRDEELQVLRAALVEAQTEALAAEQAAAAARATVTSPTQGISLRSLWIELNRAANRAVTAVALVGAAGLMVLAILVGFMLGRRQSAALASRGAVERSAVEAVDDAEAVETVDDEPPASEAAKATKDSADSTAALDIESQLDLARAYVDMGDAGAARRTLKAVIKAGSPDQRRQAETLLADLESASKDGEANSTDDQR